MADARNNALPIIEGTYVLMQDVDRYDDTYYETLDDAREALDAAEEDGEEEMWIGCVEDGEIIFQ